MLYIIAQYHNSGTGKLILLHSDIMVLLHTFMWPKLITHNFIFSIKFCFHALEYITGTLWQTGYYAPTCYQCLLLVLLTLSRNPSLITIKALL